jgi:hypothetical protein
MKLFTPEKAELLNVTSVAAHRDGIIIHGRIMGAMPMKAVLTPQELRHTFRLFGPKLYWTLLVMLFKRGPRPSKVRALP